MKLKRPIKALLIDDQGDYYNSIKANAMSQQIILEHASNLEDGMVKLGDNKQIDFVILDAKCFLDSEKEVSGSTVSNMPLIAKDQIEDLNRSQNRQITYCVNTGFSEYEEFFEGVFEVFKKDDSDILFDYVKASVLKSTDFKIKNQNTEVFQVFDQGLIESKYQFLLLDIFNCLDKKDFKKKNFGPIRDLLEASFESLMNVGCIPSTFLTNKNKPNLEWCTRFLEQRSTAGNDGVSHTLNKAISQDIKSIVRKLKESTSQNSHIGENEILKHEYLSNAYLMQEYLVWMTQFINQHYK